MLTSDIFSALESTLVDHEDGRAISNAPKNDAANIISNSAKRMLTTAFVDMALRALAPKMRVTANPNRT